MAPGSVKEIQERLLEAGNRLLQPPSRVDDLLPLLDQLEDCLALVVQSPPDSIQNSLSPVLKALIADELLKHPNVDVKVAVAACISEITRISAPNAPYDDGQMKEVFQLIVSSFENLCDKTSRSYNKRASILETVARVRSCVVMLDLECDALIIEMFQHFLKSTRDTHSEGIFTSMETIMTLILEESEDISVDFLLPLLDGLKNNTKDPLPTARRLSEKVLKNCATKLKPYLIEAVQGLGIVLDDYSKVLASICLEPSCPVEQGDHNISGENQVAVENAAKMVSHEEVYAAEDRALKAVNADEDCSLKAVTSNGTRQDVDGGSVPDSDSLKKVSSQPENISMPSQSDLNDGMDARMIPDSEARVKQNLKRQGRNPSSVSKSTEPSAASPMDVSKVSQKLPDRPKGHCTEACDSLRESSIVAATPLENNNATTPCVSTSKASDSEAGNSASPTGSGSAIDETSSRKAGQPKKSGSTHQQSKPSSNVTRGLAKEAGYSGVKRPRRGKKKTAVNAKAEKVPPPKTVKNEDLVYTSEGKSLQASGKKVNSSNNCEGKIKVNDLEAEPLKLSGKKVNSSIEADDEIKVNALKGEPLKLSEKRANSSSKSEEKSSANKKQIRKNRGRKRKMQKVAEEVDKEMVASPMIAKSIDEPLLVEITNAGSKGKHVPRKYKGPDVKEFGENLVGCRIKVLWPDDEMYYDGVIDSFDPAMKKHTVLYTDGDVECLNLKEEDWMFIDEKSEPPGEQEADLPSPDASSELHKKGKSKTGSDPSSKRGRPSKRGGASKPSSVKAGLKSADGVKAGNPKDDSVKATDKSEDLSSVKSKSHTGKSGGKSVDDSADIPKAIEDGSADTSKAVKKAKQETPRATTKTTSRKSKGGKKTGFNGSGKVESGSSKAQELVETLEEASQASGKAAGRSEKPKAALNSPQGQKSERKRRRG